MINLNPSNKTKLSILSFLSVVKRFDKVSLYGQVIMPLMGILHLFVERRFFKVSIPILLMIGLNFLTFVQFGFDSTVFARLGQLTLIICFSNFFAFNNTKESFASMATGVTIVTGVMFVLEVIFIDPLYVPTVLSSETPRYSFIVGEVNFSAALFTGMFFLCRLYGLSKLAIFFFIFSLLTVSRGAWVALMAWGVLTGLSYLLKKNFKIVHYLALSFFLVYPFVMIGANKVLPVHVGEKMTGVSPRYYLHAVYSLEGISNPVGVGYFNSRKKIADYLESYEEDFPWLLKNVDLAEQHSLQVQVLSDFGILGYLLFSWFIFSIGRITSMLGNHHSLYFVSLLSLFTFVNGLNEWIFWISIGCYLSAYLKSEKFNSSEIIGFEKIK